MNLLMGRHLSNTYNPYARNARDYMVYSFEAMDRGAAGRHEEWDWYMDWIKRNIIGPPQATPYYTVEQLQAMGMVGVYAPCVAFPKGKFDLLEAVQ